MENLAYALTQVAHNFGAVAVLGGALCGRLSTPSTPAARRLAWLILAGWLTQMASGLSFGLVSLLHYGQLPDIHGIAVAALFTKIFCAVAGLLLVLIHQMYAPAWSPAQRNRSWLALSLLAAVALTAAAFLRWYS